MLCTVAVYLMRNKCFREAVVMQSLLSPCVVIVAADVCNCSLGWFQSD